MTHKQSGKNRKTSALRVITIVVPLLIIGLFSTILIRDLTVHPVQAIFDETLDEIAIPTIPPIPTVPAIPTVPFEINPCGCDCECPTPTTTPTEVTPTQEITPTETLTPIPTNPPTGGGGGGGGGNGGGGGGGAPSGGGQVLGAATLAPTGTFSQTLANVLFTMGLAMLGLSILSYLKQLQLV